MSEQISGLFKSLSLYSPIILVSSLLIFSILSGCIEKFLFYTFIALPLIVFLRIIIFKATKKSDLNSNQIQLPIECSIGLINTFIPQDVLFSTYLLSFTLFYFLTPMILFSIDTSSNAVNYLIVLFFSCYIFLDVVMKKQMKCITTDNIKPIDIIGNFFSGVLLGGGFSSLIYISSIKNLLFINETSSNKEVCSMPSEQKFKCRVYKNGELVASTMS